MQKKKEKKEKENKKEKIPARLVTVHPAPDSGDKLVIRFWDIAILKISFPLYLPLFSSIPLLFPLSLLSPYPPIFHFSQYI